MGDLGMELDYKRDLGGVIISRDKWAEKLRSLREQPATLSTPSEDADGDAVALISHGSAAADAEDTAADSENRKAAPKAATESKKDSKKDRREKKRRERELQSQDHTAEPMT